jgi:hypothetical protein
MLVPIGSCIRIAKWKQISEVGTLLSYCKQYLSLPSLPPLAERKHERNSLCNSLLMILH